MARSRSTSSDKPPHSSTHRAHSNGDHLSAAHQAPEVQDWINGPLAAPKKAVDSLLDMQCQWLKTASMGNETLAMELKELQQAKDPVEFLSAQFSLANQQMEVLSRQVAAVMQQLYDAQLMWLGQWDEKTEGLQSVRSPEKPGASVLDAMGRMQDDWLKATQNWVDSISASNRPR